MMTGEMNIVDIIEYSERNNANISKIRDLLFISEYFKLKQIYKIGVFKLKSNETYTFVALITCKNNETSIFPI